METELIRLWRATRKSWWIPILFALILGPAAFIVGGSFPETYVARSQLLVTPVGTGSGTLANDSQRPETYRQLVKSGPVLDSVIIELDLDLTRDELASKIETIIVPGTTIFEIQVRDAEPEVAAEINNAVARQVESKVADLTMGQMQRNLDELDAQLATQRDQLVVIETRLTTIDTSENADSTEIQAEITSLRQRRLEVQQTIADLEASARLLRSEIAKNVVPIAIVDSARSPSDPEGATPLILGALGAMIGVGAGILIGLWREYANPYVRDERHVRELLAIDAVTRVPVADESVSDTSGLKLAAARIAGLARTAESSSVLFVTPRENDKLRTIADAMQNAKPMTGLNVAKSYGMLDTGEGADAVVSGSPAMLFVEAGKTRSEDIQEIADVLIDLGVSSVSTTILEQ